MEEKIAVDSNIIIAALLKGKAYFLIKEFSRQGINFISTKANQKEVLKYLPFIAEKLELKVDFIKITFSLLPIKYLEPSKKFLEKAKVIIRDPDDVPLLAIALEHKIPVWTNDKDFENTGIEVITTQEMAKKFYKN